MGLYSWLDAVDRKQIQMGDTVYLLIPDEFVSIYGTSAYKGRYDGYGRVGIYDVYEEMANMNRSFISVKNMLPPLKISEFCGLYPYEIEDMRKEGLSEEEITRKDNAKRQGWYEKAVKRYERSVKRIEDFVNGAGDRTLLRRYGDDYLREIGIDIGCEDEQNRTLKYPLKITKHSDVTYEECWYSKSDTMQGCD